MEKDLLYISEIDGGLSFLANIIEIEYNEASIYIYNKRNDIKYIIISLEIDIFIINILSFSNFSNFNLRNNTFKSKIFSIFSLFLSNIFIRND